MIITPVDAGRILGIGERRVRQLVQAGVLKSEGRFGATIAVDRESVLALKRKRGKAKQRAALNGKH